MKSRACCTLLSLLFGFQLSACLKADLPAFNVDRDAVHIVRKGDTLYAIGKRYNVDYKLLARRNHIGVPYTVFIGQRLFLWRQAPKSTYMPIPKPHKKLVQAKRRVPHSAHKKGKSVASKKTRRKRFPVAGSKSFTRLNWPVQGKISSRFGHRGRHMHDGIDIAAPEGTPIHAAAAGEVVYADQRLAGYGKLIIVRHQHAQFTAYAHNQRNLVRKGDRVAAGDVIARVGKTGRARAPHLHFEIRRGSTPVDPLSYLPRR